MAYNKGMNTKPKTMNKQVLVLFPEDLKTRFDQACKDRGETPSDVLRRLAETYAKTPPKRPFWRVFWPF